MFALRTCLRRFPIKDFSRLQQTKSYNYEPPRRFMLLQEKYIAYSMFVVVTLGTQMWLEYHMPYYASENKNTEV